MLILTRRTGETIMIGNDITVTVLSVTGNQVRMGVTAPKDVAVHREEVAERIAKQMAAAQQRCSYCGQPKPAGTTCRNDLCLACHGEPQ